MAAKFGVKLKSVQSKILKLYITKHYVLSTSKGHALKQPIYIKIQK